MESVGVKVTEREFSSLSGELVKDLTAMFNVMEDEINKLVQEGIKEGWTPEELIIKIENTI